MQSIDGDINYWMQNTREGNLGLTLWVQSVYVSDFLFKKSVKYPGISNIVGGTHIEFKGELWQRHKTAFTC